MFEFEQKGYFEFIVQMAKLLDNAVVAYGKTNMEEEKEYSLWKIFRELNSREVKQSLGFMLTLMKNTVKESKQITQ